MSIDNELFTDELVNRVKRGQIKPAQNPDTSGILKVISELNHLPKARIPRADFAETRNRIMDRIAIPVQEETLGLRNVFSLSRFIRIAGSITAGFLVIISLTVGTAVAALESVPGQPIYPLKKMVESVQLKLARNNDQKTNLQIKFANNRLEELEVVLKQSHDGEFNEEEAQKIVTEAVKDLQQKTVAAANSISSTDDQPKVEMLTKIVNLSNKQTALLKSASIQTEGVAKIEIEKALETTKITKEQAIENIEKAGLVVEEEPILIEEEIIDESEVTTKGKITSVEKDSIKLGTAQFFLTENTKYTNVKAEELKTEQLVDIKAEIRDNKTYAVEIILIKSESETTDPETNTETEE